jgi:predicted lipoprotein with Yx(FWY)xxD motif
MSNSFLRRVPLPVKLGVLVCTALLAAACGSSTSSSSSASTATGAAAGSSSSAPAPASSSAPAPATSSASAAAAATVITTHTGTAGTYLTNGSGRSVYLWVKDPMGKSVCDGACASAWPPVTTTGTPTASGGAVATDLGTFTRSDGSKQVTYDGHPLYYFAGDSGPGMTAGQGLNGFGALWWLVAPSGSSITGSGSGSGSGGGGGSSTTPAPAASTSSAKAGGSWS